MKEHRFHTAYSCAPAVIKISLYAGRIHIGKRLLICHALPMRHPRTFDTSLTVLVARIPKKYESLINAISNVGGFWFAAFVLTVLFIVAMVFNERQLLTSLIVTAALAPLAELIKLLTRRNRPETLYVRRMKFKTYSFPSGHSYVSALIALYTSILTFVYIVSPLNWIIAATLVGFALLVGISRVYLGAHFPSDVIAGWVLASLIILLLAPLIRMLP